MSPLLCFLGLATAFTAPPDPVYEVPRVLGLKVDGAASDWKTNGFRVATMSGSQDIPATTLDGKFRVAWDERGLVVVVGVKDDVPLESADSGALYAGDSVELFVTTSRGARGQFYQVVASPGVSKTQPDLRYKIYDQRTDSRLKAKPLTATLARMKLKDGYVMEVLLPWSNLGITPEAGLELGFQVYVNDSDAPDDHKQLRWFADSGAFADPSKMNRIRLSEKASSPVSVVANIDYPKFRATQAALVAPQEMVGETAELFLDGVSRGTVKLGERNGRAFGFIDAPLPDRLKPYSTATVLLQGTYTAVALPDYALMARQTAENLPLDFGGFVFSGTVLPKPEFADSALARTVLGSYIFRYAYYDAAGNPVDKATEVGRYGAMVAILPQDGLPIRRYVTLYRRPDGAPMWSPGLGTKFSWPTNLGIDPKVADSQVEYGGRLVGGLLEQYNAKMPELAMLLAGLREATPDDPPVDRLGPDRRDERYWHGLRRRLGIVETYPYAVMAPNGYATDATKRWPTILFLHGSGERGNNLDVVKKVGLPPEAAKRPNFPFLVIAPQCPIDQRWNTSALLDLIEEAKKKYRIDPDRLYVSGLSMGGYGAWELAAERPDLFAAAVPICGGYDPADALRLKDLPIWAFHGEADPVVPVANTTAMIGALRAVGSTARMTLYPGVGHDSWSTAYATDVLYTWLLQQTRKRP